TPLQINTNITTPDGVSRTYQYYLTTGNYQIDNVTRSVYIAGSDVNIYVPSTGKIQQTGNDTWYVAATDPISGAPAHVNLYAGPASVKIAGNGIINGSGNALGFTYFGLNSNTSLQLSGNAAITAVIYAPYADYTLGGGGTSIYDFIGASVSKTVTMNGHFNFHYDENLRRVGPNRGYVATQWKEL